MFDAAILFWHLFINVLNSISQLPMIGFECNCYNASQFYKSIMHRDKTAKQAKHFWNSVDSKFLIVYPAKAGWEHYSKLYHQCKQDIIREKNETFFYFLNVTLLRGKQCSIFWAPSITPVQTLLKGQDIFQKIRALKV